MKQIIIPILLLTAIVVTTTQQVQAFPCSGGSGKDYCSGYHKGAVQADKDFANPGSGSGGIFDSTCPSGHTADYCNGWTRGYDDESQQLD